MNKHQVLRAFLIAAISVWTTRDHPGNYIAAKIAECGRQYEMDCNSNRIERFWFGQFDSDNTGRFAKAITDTGIISTKDIGSIYRTCSTKGFYSFK